MDVKTAVKDASAETVMGMWGIALIGAAASGDALNMLPYGHTVAATFIAGCAGSLIAIAASKGSLSSKVAMVFSCLPFAMFFGPITAHLIVSSTSIGEVVYTQALWGTSFAWAIFGWPFYKTLRALFSFLEQDDALTLITSAFLNKFRRHK